MSKNKTSSSNKPQSNSKKGQGTPLKKKVPDQNWSPSPEIGPGSPVLKYIHVFALPLNFTFTILTLNDQKPLWEQFFYLTNITQILITIYYAWALFTDFKKKGTYSSTLVNFYRITSSLSFIVFLSYWGLRMVKKELVIKAGSNPPLILSVYCHGINTLILYAENLFRKFPRFMSRSKAILIYLGILIFYISLMNFHTYFSGNYIYGFLKEFGLIGNCLFYAANYIIILMVDLIFSSLVMVPHN